jgi:hypothetical protein
MDYILGLMDYLEWCLAFVVEHKDICSRQHQLHAHLQPAERSSAA